VKVNYAIGRANSITIAVSMIYVPVSTEVRCDIHVRIAT